MTPPKATAKKPTVDTSRTATVEVYVAGIPYIESKGGYGWDVEISEGQTIQVLDFGETWEKESGVLVYAVVTDPA